MGGTALVCLGYVLACVFGSPLFTASDSVTRLPACIHAPIVSPHRLPLSVPSPRKAGDFTNGEEVSQLVKAAGGKLLSRPPAAAPAPRAASGPCTSFLLCEAAEPGVRDGPVAGVPAGEQQQGQQEGAEAEGQGKAAVPPALAASKWFQKAAEGGVPVVSHRWLLDSIGRYTPQPLAGYRLA